MEFITKGSQPTQQKPAPAPNSEPASKTKKKRIDWVARTVRFELFIVIVGSALILLALSLWLATGNYMNAEAKLVNTSEYQAVYLTTSSTEQAYFGKITELNNKFIVLSDVFYLVNPSTQSQDGTASTSTNYSLRKLGVGQLHAPEDKLIINREHVIYWENLKDSGQVVTKIKEYNANPSGSSQTSIPASDTSTPSSSTPTQ